MALEQDLQDIRLGLKAGRYGNEAAVSQGIVLRILQALSWPTYDTQLVSPEYRVEGLRVDYALCNVPRRPAVFVEVKQVGQSDGAERQLFEYAFREGVPMAILTDGVEWSFFLPGEQGDYRERRVYKLDLIERDLGECSRCFERYLRHEAVVSGRAIEDARLDYRNLSRARLVKSKLPEAWNLLIQEEDELLLEVIADRAERLCGYKPSPDDVASFLRDLRNPQPVQSSVPQPANPPRIVTRNPETIRNQNAALLIGYTLSGKQHSARSAIEVLISLFEEFSRLDQTFCERFGALPRHGRSRRYLARNPQDLYPTRPDLSRDCSRQLASGWWVSTNHSKETIRRIIEMAAEVLGPRIGAGFDFRLGD